MHAIAALALRPRVERAAAHRDALSHADKPVTGAGPAVRSGSRVVVDLDLEHAHP